MQQHHPVAGAISSIRWVAQSTASLSSRHKACTWATMSRPALHVEADRGLVEDQQARPVQQGAANLDPALHPAAERAHLAPGPVEQAQPRPVPGRCGTAGRLMP